MSVASLLAAKAEDYELMAEFHGERAPVDEEHALSALVFMAVAVCLREVAEALEEELG